MKKTIQENSVDAYIHGDDRIGGISNRDLELAVGERGLMVKLKKGSRVMFINIDKCPDVPYGEKGTIIETKKYGFISLKWDKGTVGEGRGGDGWNEKDFKLLSWRNQYEKI